jgi:hypothetical protein
MTPTSEQVSAHAARFLDRMEQGELAIVRRAYAKHVLANADVDDARVEAAFAAVRREAFLGPGPWSMLRWPHRYVPTPSDDPVYLYQDALVGIVPERSLNNGQPWLHAMLIAAAGPRPGEHVVHIGAGVGYYTAILAHMVVRERPGDGDRIRWRPRRAPCGEFRRAAQCAYLAGRRRADRVRCGRCNLRERRGEPPGRHLARPAQRWRPTDPAADLGQRLRGKPRKHTDPAAAARYSASSAGIRNSPRNGFRRSRSFRVKARATPSQSGRWRRRSRRAAGTG